MTIRVERVAILGTGNGGCACAVDLVNQDLHVTMHTTREARAAELRAAGGLYARGIHDGFVPVQNVTTDLEEAVKGVDLIVLAVPATAHGFYATELAQLLEPHQLIMLNPGHTGGSLHFRAVLRREGYDKTILLCETATLTYICRLDSPTTVAIYSRNSNVSFAALPTPSGNAFAYSLRPLFPGLQVVTDVLETGLSNINAILHPPGMLLNAGWIESTGGAFMFYHSGITEAVGNVMERLDEERRRVAEALGIPISPLIQVLYDTGLTTEAALDSGSLSAACQESQPNAAIRSPASLSHRYLDEDVAYGLVPMAELGLLAGVQTPCIDALVEVASAATARNFRQKGLTLDRMGLSACEGANVRNALNQEVH